VELSVKRGIVAFAFALGLATQPALAARIYNLTPVPLQVQSPGNHIRLGAGQRSESLSWKTTTVTVRDNEGREVCRLDFGMRNEVAGGQYMLIAHHGFSVKCSLCDGDGKLMASASGQFAPYNAPSVASNKSDKWSCP
jgi:hypothetical protein